MASQEDEEFAMLLVKAIHYVASQEGPRGVPVWVIVQSIQEASPQLTSQQVQMFIDKMVHAGVLRRRGQSIIAINPTA